MLHATCPLLKVKRRTYSSPCTDCSFIKHDNNNNNNNNNNERS